MIKLKKEKKDVLFLLLIITSSSWLNKIRWTSQNVYTF